MTHPAGRLHALAELAPLPAAPPTPRPLPPPPWPLQGLTPTAEVLPRLLEAVRALEGSVWALHTREDAPGKRLSSRAALHHQEGLRQVLGRVRDLSTSLCEILMRDGVPETDARAEVAPLQTEKILAFLADGPKTNAEIGKVLHILPRYFGATLRKLHEAGRVSKRLVKGAGLARSGLVLWALPGCEECLELMARRIIADPPAEMRATRTNMGMPRRRVA